jgi:hypothetical protein
LDPGESTSFDADAVCSVADITVVFSSLKERRRVEDQYAQALNKLSRKHIPQDISDLG